MLKMTQNATQTCNSETHSLEREKKYTIPFVIFVSWFLFCAKENGSEASLLGTLAQIYHLLFRNKN